jgi:Mycolic acid cyclopropane synthetase
VEGTTSTVSAPVYRLALSSGSTRFVVCFESMSFLATLHNINLSSLMSSSAWTAIGSTLGIVPQKDSALYSYNDVRPHHVVAIYVAAWWGWNHVLPLASKMLKASSEKGSSVSSSSSNSLTRALVAATSRLSEVCIPLIQQGWIPDIVIRWGIRMQLRHHLHQLGHHNVTSELDTKLAIVTELSNMPIAIATHEANDQHYEVPTAFYDLCLGPAKKYSSGYWPTTTTSFAESEQHMLQLYCDRAHVKDGMSIVDLGCGWGSLTLYLLQHYPNCSITAISNSASQREYILATAQARGLNMAQLKIITVRASLKRVIKVCVLK